MKNRRKKPLLGVLSDNNFYTNSCARFIDRVEARESSRAGGRPRPPPTLWCTQYTLSYGFHMCLPSHAIRFSGHLFIHHTIRRTEEVGVGNESLRKLLSVRKTDKTYDWYHYCHLHKKWYLFSPTLYKPVRIISRWRREIMTSYDSFFLLYQRDFSFLQKSKSRDIKKLHSILIIHFRSNRSTFAGPTFLKTQLQSYLSSQHRKN